MTPELVLFGIKALIRVGQQTNKALIDYAADRPAMLNSVEVIKLTDKRDLLNNFLMIERYKELSKAEPFASIWDPTIPGGGGIGASWDELTGDQQAAAYLFALDAARGDGEALAELGSESFKAGPYASDALAGQVLIEQWKPENKPVSPFGRIALAIVEAGIDYARSNPGIFGVGKSGEKVISAFAIALATPLTAKLNAATLGTQMQLVNTIMMAFVGAGLQTLKDQSADLISDQHLARLVGNVLDPVVTAAKGGDVLFQVQLQRIADALAGPAAQAAIKTIADNPGAFLGKNFDSAKAAGALVSAVLVESAKNPDVSVTFSENGRLRLLSAALQVIAEKPGLFIKSGDSNAVASLATDLTSSLATQLKANVLALIDDKTIDAGALAAGIAAAALQAVGRHSDALIDSGTGGPWHEVARKIAKSVLDGLVVAIKSPDGPALKGTLSEEKLIELGRIVAEDIAANPGMTGVSDAKAREIIAIVAKAVAAVSKEKKALFAPDDWLELARAMVKEVAARPGVIAGSDAGLQAVVTALATVIAGDKNSVMSRANAMAVAQTLLAEVVGHPAMLAGLKDEVQRVVLAVAAAMAADRNLLLSGGDWVEILKVCLSEASANPARLFSLNYNDANQALAADVISLVLKAVPTLPAAGGGTSGLILKGDVLREATIVIVRSMSGVPDRAKKYLPLLQSALLDLSAFVGRNSGNYGSREWLGLIRVLTGDILNGKYDAELTLLLANPSNAVTLLSGPNEADAMLARAA